MNDEDAWLLTINNLCVFMAVCLFSSFPNRTYPLSFIIDMSWYFCCCCSVEPMKDINTGKFSSTFSGVFNLCYSVYIFCGICRHCITNLFSIFWMSLLQMLLWSNSKRKPLNRYRLCKDDNIHQKALKISFLGQVWMVCRQHPGISHSPSICLDNNRCNSYLVYFLAIFLPYKYHWIPVCKAGKWFEE
jgi:hypothetical protein